ncbi:hypothetical protein F5888DRAFT_1711927 [Russula emetica]|nr:hypothetical protein F5888DRAFT_1711927 [Russula emetica]
MPPWATAIVIILIDYGLLIHLDCCSVFSLLVMVYNGAIPLIHILGWRAVMYKKPFLCLSTVFGTRS